jgi:hypothetical protein
MVALIEQQKLPSFALAFYKQLARSADPRQRPARLAWIGEDLLLLAPYRIDEGHWGGFLIAESEAAGQPRRLWSETGEVLWVQVPESVANVGAVMAEEGSILPIAESPPAPHCGSLPLPRSSGSTPG